MDSNSNVPSNIQSDAVHAQQASLNIASASTATNSSFQRIPSSNARPTRELKVEDALLYLDQVKMEFSDKPHIYNEFLDIMKNFKAQSINTPGVIERVKTLFKGHNKLILGFNTFLPEGEGYKIELSAEEQEGSDPVTVITTIVSKPAPSDTSEHISPLKSNPVFASTVPVSATFQPNAPPISNPLTSTPAIPTAAGSSTSPPPGQMQQAHAFHYVTKIRDRFTNEPETYRSFLKILHTYQKEQKNIKEVLEQVSQLFADHADLLMEFTYFLPDAVQDQAKERLERAARESEARKNAKLQAQKQRKSAGSKINPAMGMSSMMLGTGMGGSHPGSNAVTGAGGMTSILHGGAVDMNLTGNKRGRNVLDSTSTANVSGSAFPPNYAMQLAAHGLDESQLHLARMQPANKKQNLGAGGMMVGMPSSTIASSMTLQQQLLQQQQRKPRRKNAQGQGGENLASNNVMFDNRGMNEMLGPGNVVGNKLLGYPSSVISSSQQMLFHQQQQSFLGASNGTIPGLQRHVRVEGVSSKDAHVSISAERRFFDQIKDALVVNSRDSWSEFVKCLELFTDDKINKDELLKLVEELLQDHSDLLKEFQRLLESRVDYQGNKEDMWFSVPLSEIDFAQCRKCTPSYRALPRDYPRPKCSERSEEEEKFLNDVWVSIPIGSEESSSFKHMRKNQYEEALFKCEDERFEIDMVIDSNMSTIRVLEPLAEEIVHWKTSLGSNSNSATVVKREGTLPSAISTTASGGMPRFSLQLEKRQLTTIHLNAISRIYGDHGEEILELLRKNPVGTIPVVLRRLKQKDQEWRRARHELNKHWKDVVERNHYKSFDHRSFYFRQNDKKYLSTKPLVQEIVTAAQQQIQQSGAVASVATTSATNRSSVSIMAALAASAAAQQASDNSHNAGVHYSLDEEYPQLLAGMTPHMILSYPNQDHLVHRDIYRIVCHAAENILTNPTDKERLAALWRDLLRIFFNLPAHYLYSVAPSSSSANASVLDADVGGNVAVTGEAWSVDTKVITIYGSGVIKGFREADNMYEVQLPFGKAYLPVSAILGAEQLSSQALYAIGVTTDAQTRKETIFNGAVSSDATASTSRKGGLFVQDPSKLFYGTQMCYVFFRLHHALFTRLSIARKLAQEMIVPSSAVPPTTGLGTANLVGAAKRVDILLHSRDVEDDKDDFNSIQPCLYSAARKPIYPHFLGQVYALMEGSVDSSRFEDFCRSTLGNKSYILFTLDKIIHQLIKHLQAMANDDNVNKLIGLFVYHHQKQPEEGVDSILYKNHVAHILSHTMEEIFRVQLLCPASGLMALSSEVAIQYLGIVNPSAAAAVAAAAAASAVNEASSIPSSLSPSKIGKVALKGKRLDSSSGKKEKAFLEKEYSENNENRLEEELEAEELDEMEEEELIDDREGINDGAGVQTIEDSRGDGRSGRSGNKVPKAVVSDDDEDDDDEDADEDALKNDETSRKVVFSPRIRQ